MQQQRIRIDEWLAELSRKVPSEQKISKEE